MIQIRIHGRGGQGVVTASELIAIAAFIDGKQSQAFPSFGVERTGAPVESYVRIDNKPITTHEQIYQPDILIIQDSTLLNNASLINGVGPKTKIIINTSKDKSIFKLKLPQKNIYTIDATKIAMEILGKNIVNTVILGALVKFTNIISLASLMSAIKEKFADKNKELIAKNINAVKLACSL
ncbi:MAG: 2-oxoacid:acceptor oxidoreductase family protein [bacterium]|nr:2-oxoacid:acceptor oxidoreductase family protein [bacterium]